jgi:hypothetical protein
MSRITAAANIPNGSPYQVPNRIIGAPVTYSKIAKIHNNLN